MARSWGLSGSLEVALCPQHGVLNLSGFFPCAMFCFLPEPRNSDLQPVASNICQLKLRECLCGCCGLGVTLILKPSSHICASLPPQELSGAILRDLQPFLHIPMCSGVQGACSTSPEPSSTAKGTWITGIDTDVLSAPVLHPGIFSATHRHHPALPLAVMELLQYRGCVKAIPNSCIAQTGFPNTLFFL